MSKEEGANRSGETVAGWSRALARLQSRHPRAIVAFAVLVTALAAWPIARARFSADLTDLLPADSRAAQALKTFRAAFGQSDQLVLAAVRRDGASAQARPTPAEWIAALRSRLERRSEVRKVEGGPLEALTQFATAVLPSAGFAYLTADEAAQLRQTLTREGLARAFARDVRLLEQSPGLDANELVRRDPLFLREVVAGRAAQFFGGASGAAPPGDDALALLTIGGHRPAQDLPESRALVAAVDAEVAALGVPDHLRLLETGGYAIAVEDEARIRGDLTGSTVSSIVLVLLLSWLAHRRFAPVLMTSFVVLLGIVWAYGAFLALRGSVTMLTAVGAAMLVGLGDDYGVHLHAEYARARGEGLGADAARRTMIERAGPRIVVAALTSIGCFAAFGMTGFRGLADLGLLAAIGLFTCLLAFLVVFPLLLRHHTPHAGRTPMSIVAGGLAELPLRLPRLSLGLVGLLTAASIALLALRGPPSFVGDARLLHPDRSPALEALAQLDRIVKRPLVPWIVLAEGADADALSGRFAALEAQLAPLVDAGLLAAVQLPPRALPPRAAQEAAFAALTLDGGLDPEATARELHVQAEAAGFDAEAFAALERSVRDNLARAARRDFVTLEELHRLGAGELADSFFRPHGAGGSGLVAAGYLFPVGGLLPGPEQADAVARVEAALAPTPGFALTGFSVVAAELTSRVRRDFRGITGLATAVVILLVLASSRSWLATALALLPVGLSVVWLLALMRLCDAHFNVLNIVLVPMLVGLGVDNGIHLVFDARATGDPARSLRNLFTPMLVSAVTTIAGFGSLATVGHPAVASMGELTAAGITLALLATLLVLPPLLQRIVRAPAQKPK